MASAPEQTFEAEIEAVRKRAAKKITDHPLNWLSLAGLFWLEQGENAFGSEPSNAISLEKFPLPNCGSLRLRGRDVILRPNGGVSMTMNGGAVESRPLRSDREKDADLIEVGSLTLKIIERGDAILLRIWDREAPLSKNFSGFNYFPPDPAYRITARFVPYDPPRAHHKLDIIGTETESFFVGQAQFTIDGKPCTLEAEQTSDGFEFNFTDLTKDEATYPGGRYFTVPAPQGDSVVLDFNLAENWPCAYTAFATCPVPPLENRLSVRINAGEKRYLH